MFGRKQKTNRLNRRKVVRLREALKPTAMRFNTATSQPLIRSIKARLARYEFYHKIEIFHDVFTPGELTKEQEVVLDTLANLVEPGFRVIDLGCADGLFALRAEALGASRVVAVDRELSKGLRDFLIPWFDSKIEYMIGNFLEIDRKFHDSFDTVVFSGLLYHLRYPMLGLKLAHDLLKTDGTLVLETAFIDEFGDIPILFCPIGDFSPYEPSSVTFFNKRGLIDTLHSFGFSDIREVEAFTYERNRKTRYDEYEFQSDTAKNIGRMIVTARKRPGVIAEWRDQIWTPEITREQWNS